MKKIILLVLIWCSTGLYAQYKQPYFNTITVDDGLPQPNINSTLEDKYGYLWFGTDNGLVRYDGYKLKPYPLFNQDGLPANPAIVTTLFEDSKGKLWAFVNGEGIYSYDRYKDKFIKTSFGIKEAAFFKNTTLVNWKEDKQHNSIWMYSFDREKNKPTIYSFNLATNKLEAYNIFEKGNHFIPSYISADISFDANGKTWLVSDSLLSYFEPSTKSFKPYFVLPDTSGKQFFQSVVTDPVDKDLLWINIGKFLLIVPEPKINRKLLLYNTKTKTYKISAPNSKDPFALPGICFHTIIDSLKRVWLSTEKGLSLYNRNTRGFTNYPIKFQDSTNHSEIITANKDGNIWISGINSDLFFYDIKKTILYPYKSNDGLGSLPMFRNINKMFYDRSGTLWLNMPNNGIAWLNRQKTQFSPMPIIPFPKANGIKEMPSHYNIVGTQGDSICFLSDTSSLVAWNTLKNSFENIDLKEKQLYKNLSSITKSIDGSIWIAAPGNGLIQYKPESKTVIKFINDPKNKNSIASLFIYSVLADKSGVIWIGTSDQGLNSYNPTTKKFTRYPFVINNGRKQVKDSLDDMTAVCLYFDKEDILWIGTGNGGVNSYNPKTGKFRSYLNYNEGLFAIPTLFEDSRKRLWVSTFYSGVYLLNKQTGFLKRFSEKEGLIFNGVLGINEDEAGNIWLATTKGMSRINPLTNSITNFPAARPVANDFIINNFKDRNGIFYMQARSGILAFNPLKLDETKTLPLVYIESVGYRPTGESSDTLVFTEGREKIKLNYNENRINFQYIALHFADATSNQYAYQLEGYDKDWIKAGALRNATYTNLSPGTYTFKVKAANSYGEWNETGASFIITIMPAWWNTWWAYIIYALLFLAGLRAFSMYRERSLRSEKEILEEKVTSRTNALQKSLNDLQLTQKQLIQSEKMASLGELTAGIAHEIQNPLNFVNNFSEVNKELLAEMNDELTKGNIDEAKSIAKDVTDNEEKIIFHGKRADSIVKGMLQHSRASNSVKEPTDINALCDEYLRLSYHGLRARDKSFNATFKTNFDPAVGKVNIVSQDVGRVILNLLTNAFYAVGEKSSIFNLQSENQKVENPYTPTVSVSTKKLDNTTEIRVTDNGGGIPQKVEEKIFQPFFTTKPTGQGTGLGLSLSYDIITKGHGGTLTVETKEGEGSTFIIQIPE